MTDEPQLIDKKKLEKENIPLSELESVKLEFYNNSIYDDATINQKLDNIDSNTRTIADYLAKIFRVLNFGTTTVCPQCNNATLEIEARRCATCGFADKRKIIVSKPRV